MSRAVSDPTEALIRLADGDRSAFDEVYAAAQPAVLRLTRRMMSGEPEAEDVAQQALLKVFEQALHYDPERGRALPWILGIAAWEVRTWRRKRSRRREEFRAVEQTASDDPALEAERRELAALLRELLDDMNPNDLAILMAAAGLADRPDVAPATYRKRLQRALGRLRTAWRREHG